MRKRGQLNQVFVFIFIAVVIALLFLFGSNLLVKIFSFGKDVETEKFIKDLKQQIELVHTYNLGSKISLDKIKVPKQVKKICFSYQNMTVETKEKNEEEKIAFLRSDLGCVNTLEGVIAEKKIIGEETFVLVK